MAMKIWQTDPENKPKERVSYSDNTDGAFSIGKQDENGDPVALDTFRLMTAKPEVAAAVAQLLGGNVVETETASENFIEVVTEADKIPVIVDGPGGLYSDFKSWNRGKLTHHCDGVSFLSHPSNDKLIGKACGCPELFAERKQAARDGIGPSPSIELKFRLADDPDLGTFKFKTGAWTLAGVLHESEARLERIKGEALVELSLEFVEFIVKKGKNKGTQVSYYRPGIEVIKSYGDAIADEPPF